METLTKPLETLTKPLETLTKPLDTGINKFAEAAAGVQNPASKIKTQTPAPRANEASVMASKKPPTAHATYAVGEKPELNTVFVLFLCVSNLISYA